MKNSKWCFFFWGVKFRWWSSFSGFFFYCDRFLREHLYFNPVEGKKKKKSTHWVKKKTRGEFRGLSAKKPLAKNKNSNSKTSRTKGSKTLAGSFFFFFFF